MPIKNNHWQLIRMRFYLLKFLHLSINFNVCFKLLLSVFMPLIIIFVFHFFSVNHQILSVSNQVVIQMIRSRVSTDGSFISCLLLTTTTCASWQAVFTFNPQFQISTNNCVADADIILMVALWNRADHYIFILWFLSMFFFSLA